MSVRVLSLSFIFCAVACHAIATSTTRSEDPELTIRVGTNSKTWHRSELLRSKELENIQVPSDPTYGRLVQKFKAIRASVLFKRAAGRASLTGLVKEGAVLQFSCVDGFSAQLPMQLVMNADDKKSVAYIAIEPPRDKWPELKGAHPHFKTAGPYYLIWVNAEKSHIGPEQWPYQLTSFTVKPPLEKQFPDIVPNTQNKNVLAGYQLFVKNCFACHTMNGEGDSRLGPDLNLPMNPTEYLRPGMIRRLIRNPQNLRQWPESKMSAFGPDVLSDQDIDRIIRYLRFMAGQKSRGSHSRLQSK